MRIPREIQRLLCCISFSVLVLATAAHAADDDKRAEDSRRFFAIRINDNVIGYNMVDRLRTKVDGRSLLRIDSETSMKFAVLGKQRNTLLKSQVWIDPKTNNVVRYQSADAVNELVTQHECEMLDGKVRAWKHRKGADKGEPSEIDVPNDVRFVGNNNFALWEAMLRFAATKVDDKGEVAVKVFLPEALTATEFVLERGKTLTLDVAGAKRKCRMWKLKGAGVEVAVEEASTQLVRMKIAGQEAVIELADESIVKAAQKARAEEILAKLFIQSNVIFDDYSIVTDMTAKVEIAVFGVDNAASVLQTAMQKFEGEKDDQNVVRGVMRIKVAPYEGEESPPFPSSADESLAEWTRPSPLIESNDDEIKKMSAQLTADAKDRWDAVKRVGEWVHNEIAYTIADTPSAQLCLETRKGDCGPHSTLTIAMLRAAGVPARLVGGVVFTPSFGGSFGQHAWVEVHMGKAGWVAIDPTTDEFEQISATHIKLFEGVGGVKPKSIEVQSYEPANKSDGAFTFTDPKPLNWRLNTPYVFKFRKGDSDLGDEKFSIEEVDLDGKKHLKLTHDLSLKINLLVSMTSKVALTVEPNGRPVEMKRKLTALLQTTRIDCVFKDDKVNATVTGLTRLEREIELPPGAFCFDNNFVGCWVLIASQLSLEADKPLQVRTFHPSSLQVIPLTITPKAPAKIKIGGKEVACFECNIAPIKNTFWITTNGRFVRMKQGDLVVELVELDPTEKGEK